ncbi:MAG: leucine-rich repeat protein, partial [Firmicutes bacterium]|nr:leucine-rich repeat protein [Bacillota bacterium]
MARTEPSASLQEEQVNYDASTECTRALTMYILWDALGKPDPVSTENPFQDVSADSPYFKAILWAFENKITSGVSDSEFGPDQHCNKAQVATWIWRAANEPAIGNYTLTYNDVESSSYYFISVKFVDMTGLMNPVSESVFGVYDVCKVGDLNIDKINDVFNTKYSGTCGENLQWSFNEENGSLTITGTGDMDDFIIESVIPWRKFRDQIISVTLDEGITSIGKNAFSETKLQGDFILPSSVKRIGESAFFHTQISSINFPASLEIIEKYAFRECHNLSSIDLDPDNPYFSYDGGLYQGKTLILFVSPSDDLHYSIREGTEKIDEYAFSNRHNYRSVTIPDSVTEIGVGAFSRSSLRSVEIPSSVRILGERAFAYTGLTSVSLPENLESLPDGLFEGCYFEEFTIPDTVKNMGSNMFYGCNQLKKITLPTNLKSIGRSAFLYCTALTSITLPDSLNTIPENMFYNCTSLEEIIMPASLESIGNNAFYKCSALKEIDLPNSLSTIGSSAFEECSKLSSIKLPDTLDSIGSRAFSNCTALTSFSIPEGVKFIDRITFANCENLKSIDIPKSVTVISYAAFYECKSLSKIDIPDSVTGIGESAFSGCESLESVFLPSKISEIYRSVFENCTNLKVMSVPESVKIIEQRATNGCNKLTTVLYEGSKSD